MSARHTIHAHIGRLLAGDELTDADRIHIAGCHACAAEVQRIGRLISALDSSATALVTDDLPADTLGVARQMNAESSLGRVGRLAVSIGTAVAVGLLAATIGVQASRVADGQGLGFDNESLGSTPTDHGSAPPLGSWEAFAACMAGGGYPLETYGMPGAGEAWTGVWATDDWMRVQFDCIGSSGIGEVDGDEPGEIAARNASAWAWTSCMRAEGWAMPDPTVKAPFEFLTAYYGATPPGGGDQVAYNASVVSCANQLGIPVNEEAGD